MTLEAVLPEERRQGILALLARDCKVIASDLSHTFGVSEDTIRRDLRELNEAGKLQRVHGGALPRSPGLASFTARQSQSVGAKVSIAKEAVKLISSGQVVIIDGSTTTLEVARHLASDLKATLYYQQPAHCDSARSPSLPGSHHDGRAAQ